MYLLEIAWKDGRSLGQRKSIQGQAQGLRF